MATNFSALRDKMSPERRAKVAAKTAAMIEEMPLHLIREARGLTKAQLAARLGIQQGAVSKMEKRDDMYLSTLRDAIESMGGRLELIARFSDGDVLIGKL